MIYNLAFFSIHAYYQLEINLSIRLLRYDWPASVKIVVDKSRSKRVDHQIRAFTVWN